MSTDVRLQVVSESPVLHVTITRARSTSKRFVNWLGKGGFGTVREAKNLAHRLKVAVKIAKGLQNAIQAIREG